MDHSTLLQAKVDRLTKLLRHRHYSRSLQHKLLIPLLIGFKQTVSALTVSDPDRTELVLTLLPFSSPALFSSPPLLVKTRLAELLTEVLRVQGLLTNEVVVIPLLQEFQQVLSLVGEKTHEEKSK